MTRRELRENVFMMLFRVEFHKEDELPEQLVLFEEELENLSEKDSAYINHKCNEIFTKLPELDDVASVSFHRLLRVVPLVAEIIQKGVYLHHKSSQH